MKIIPESDTVMLNSLFSYFTTFFVYFQWFEQFITSKSTIWKVDRIVSEPQIVSRVTGRSGETYQNHKTPADTRRLKRSALCLSTLKSFRLNHQ